MLLEQLINEKWFVCTEIITVFNKTYLFKDRLYENIRLNSCIKQWNGPNYNYDNSNNEKSMIISYFISEYLINMKYII